MGTATKTIYAGITTVVIAFLYLKFQQNGYIADVNAAEQQVADAWERDIKQPQKKFSRLAVGCNGNVDLIVSAMELLKKLELSPTAEKNHMRLYSLADMQETFTHFFARGQAAERSFDQPGIYKKIIDAVFSLGNVEQFIGGNAALMAQITASLFPDAKIDFVGPVGPKLQKLMPKSISIPSSSIIKTDEFHLIMEYKVGEVWGAAKAPVATRFICSYDEYNSEVRMLETFFASLKDTNPDLVMLSGLHLLDSQPPEFYLARLDTLAAKLQTVQPGLPIHLELASMVDKRFVAALLEKVLPYVTSIGLNEQEMSIASICMDGPHSAALEKSEGQPAIDHVGDVVQWLIETFGRTAKRSQSRLTRIHFHSLAFHIMASHKDHWANTLSATMAGTRIAGLQAGDLKALTPDVVDLRIPRKFKLFTGDKERTFNASNPTHTWTVGDYVFVFSPVLVCKHPVKTVGLGDAISSSGLMFSQYTP